MMEIWKKIKHFTKNIILFLCHWIRKQASFLQKNVYYHKWFIMPGDFVNKQYFKQQVVLPMWAGYKIVDQKKCSK